MKEIIKEIARIDKELEKRDKSALSRYNKGEVWEKARQTMQRLMSMSTARRKRLEAFSLEIIKSLLWG